MSPNGSARIMGEPSGAGGPAAVSDFRVAGPGFFETMGIPVLAGRTFEVADDAGAPYVAVVSAAFARIHLRGGSPIGRQVRFPGMDEQDDDRWATVIGMVGDTRHDGPGSRAEPVIYYTYRQRPAIGRTLTMVVEAQSHEVAVLGAMRRALVAAEPSVPFDGGRLTAALASVVAAPRIRAVVVGIFAGAALMLAGFGLFGVVGFVVLRRRRELGLRLALGAPAAAIVRTTAAEAAIPVAGGLVVGIGIALAAARVLRSVLFELSPVDPLILGGAAALVVVVGAVASVAPVRRALRVDPVQSLREA